MFICNKLQLGEVQLDLPGPLEKLTVYWLMNFCPKCKGGFEQRILNLWQCVKSGFNRAVLGGLFRVFVVLWGAQRLFHVAQRAEGEAHQIWE